MGPQGLNNCYEVLKYMSNWKFGELEYKRPDFDSAREYMLAEIEKIGNAETAEDVFKVIKETDDYSADLSAAITICHIRHTLNTKDSFYEKENEWIHQKLPEFAAVSVAYGDALDKSRFREDIIKKYGQMFFVNIDLSKRKFCEKNIPLMLHLRHIPISMLQMKRGLKRYGTSLSVSETRWEEILDLRISFLSDI